MDSLFGPLIATLSEHFPKNVCLQLCTYFNFSLADQDNISRSSTVGLSFLQNLTMKGLIKKGDLTKLESALEKLNLAAEARAEIRRYHEAIRLGKDVKKKTIFPIDIESEDDDEADHNEGKVTFEEFIENLGLGEALARKLTLNDFLTIKDNQELSLVEIFWHKLSSLDYRARSSSFLSKTLPTVKHQISVRDVLFALMHCSDSFLRQDIIEKMSACQLAVPVVLRGITGSKAELLTWSLRRVVKRWKEEDSIAREEHMIKFPVFTVSFIRIGEVNGVSKSAVLNMLLGPCQGYDVHPYFLCNKNDPPSMRFLDGCVEAVWYLPMKTNGWAKIKKVTSVFNLQGDSNCFPAQTRFLCQVSNLIIAFIAYENQSLYEDTIKQITLNADISKFIAVHNEGTRKGRKLKWVDDWLFVRNLDMNNLCNEICTIISSCHQKCNTRSIRSLEQMTEFCNKDIDFEENNNAIQQVKRLVKDVCDPKETLDLTEFKKQAFPLQITWREWVEIDKERLQPNINNGKTVDELLEDMTERKCEKRRMQFCCGLSTTMTRFRHSLESVKQDVEKLGYFVTYLQEKLFCLADANIRQHFMNMAQLERDISNLDERIKSAQNTNSDTLQSRQIQSSKNRLLIKRREYAEQYQKENEKSKQKNIGWEHFVRELGQWYEAHVEVPHEIPVNVTFLPGLAAKLLAYGYSLEIMDGDTGHVPISWVTSVLDKLSIDLHDPSVLVLSVVGVQSSGKSTLLNSMFGVRFPVRAGRCTRGLFVRLIRLESSYANTLGLQYIFLVDSEGLRSIERTTKDDCRFDNELVTMALCISDVTILNIGGENIGPDMLGLLRIAAHAMIRMKEVDLQPQCRIVQQRVSDPTANERNKGNMEQIVDVLNNAVINAAKEEGFEERYQQLSDVFDIRFDDNLQFLPCLWTGSMSPPNQFYGDITANLKRDILNEVRHKKIKPHLTVSTFNCRIRDVWSAVKSENFLFNFQDNVKAIDYNNLSMKLNDWIIEMRIDVIKELAVWRKKVQESRKADDKVLEDVSKEFNSYLNHYKNKIVKSFQTYAAEYKRKDALQKYERRINQSVLETTSSIEQNVLSLIKIDISTKRFKFDISSFVMDIRGKIQESIKAVGKNLGSSQMSKDEAFRLFEGEWEIWLKDMQCGDFQLPLWSESELQAHCEALLLAITSDKAVFSDIGVLMTSEGGINKHLQAPRWENYFPQKKDAMQDDGRFDRIRHSVQQIIDSTLQEMQDASPEKSFDSNLFQLLLQKALQNLSLSSETSAPPHLLKAKALLHICSKMYEISFKSQKQYKNETSFQTLIMKEKSTLREEYINLLIGKDETEQVFPYLKSVITNVLTDCILMRLKEKIIQHVQVENKLANKFVLNKAVLKHLCSQDALEEYLKYIHNYRQYMREWMNDTVINLCSQKTGDKTFIVKVADDVTNVLIKDFHEKVENIYSKVKENYFSPGDVTAYYREWVGLFVYLIFEMGYTRREETINFLKAHPVSNLEHMVEQISLYIQHHLKADLTQRIKVPVHQNKFQISHFISKLFEGTGIDFLQFVCTEQCPICKAPCENFFPLGKGHKHVSSTHIPHGIAGAKHRKSKQLVTHNCVSCAVSPSASYEIPGQRDKRLCKDYEKDYPTWSIKPQVDGSNYDKYWKWVLARFNKSLAIHYDGNQAKVPPSWRKISKQEALFRLELSKINIPHQLGTITL